MKNLQDAVLAALFDTAVDAVIIMDARGIVRVVNAAMHRMFGYNESEVVGQNIRMLMPTPYHENHDHYLAKYRSEGVRNIIGIGREVSGQRKDGSVFPLHLAVSELKHENEVLFTGILRDITDLKAIQSQLAAANSQLEERVEQATRQLRETQSELVKKEKLAALGQVAGGITHEIRNPLNAVKTSAYYLQHAKELSPEKFEEHLQRIVRQVKIIDNVISALTNVFQMPAPNNTACDLKTLVEEAIAASTVPPAIKVVNAIPPDFAPVWADPNQLSIAFQNLIRNARDAMADGGQLTIGVEIEEPHNSETAPGNHRDRVWVHITDTGIGISPDRLQHVMEPFFSTKARGMGLGLAITKAILEKNRGSITVDSTPGRGTTFRVELLTDPLIYTS